MFWLAFISIVLFILFLIVILISTNRTSTDRTLRSLKDELEQKNRALEAKKAAAVQKAANQPEAAKPKVKEVVKPAAVQTPVVPVAEERAVKPEAVTAVEPDRSGVIEKEEVTVVETPNIEEEPAASVDLPFIVEEPTAEEAIEEIIPEPEVEETVEEVIEPAVEPEPAVIEEAPVAETAVEEILEVVIAPEVEETVEEEAAVKAVPETVIETVPEVVVEEAPYTYPDFDNARTMEEFGLPKEEADEFIVDLIQQVEVEMPNLEAAVAANDSRKIEEISHMIKGSATNLGTGGIADVLIDFNTYMKTASDPVIIAGHMKNLHRALQDLKIQFQ